MVVRAPAAKEPAPQRNLRRIPLSRLRNRLGLEPYNATVPIKEAPLKAKRLKIALAQHIGAPAVPCVKKGDAVAAGQMIAAPAENALSVAIHSPIEGRILEVTKSQIIITA